MRQSVFIVLICLTVIVIAIQNTHSVPLIIANNIIKIPIAAIIVLAFTTGVVTGIVLLGKKITAHKTEIKELKRKIVFLETPDSYNKQH